MKIDFMAGLYKREPSAGDLGIDIDQTWLDRDGYMVTVTHRMERCDVGAHYVVKRLDSGLTGGVYRVRRDGVSMDHGTNRFDLVERVTRVYIAGPMSGYPDLNFPAFHEAAKEYRRRGCFVINPAEINGGDGELDEVARMTPEQYQAHWVKCMKADIAAVLTCDEVVMLDGWTRSKGANIEHHVARELGLTIHYPHKEK